MKHFLMDLAIVSVSKKVGVSDPSFARSSHASLVNADDNSENGSRSLAKKTTFV